jgi:hypothetical protein
MPSLANSIGRIWHSIGVIGTQSRISMSELVKS